MQTERQIEASEICAHGEEISRLIKANCDHEVIVVKDEATRVSEKLRGEGQAERTKIQAGPVTSFISVHAGECCGFARVLIWSTSRSRVLAWY